IRPGKKASDITPLFLDKEAFQNLIDKLANLFSDQKIDKVACIEGRGFILGSAVAYKLKLCLILIRQQGKLQNEILSATCTDYSGQEKVLEIHKDAILCGDNILIIDDWVETGNTLKTVIQLIQKCQGKVIGIGVFIDDSNENLKEYLRNYNYKFLEKVSQQDNF
ncbi:purine phosphoribosyltransferase family protein, partial [Patescibacteria group bacterium]|nr:purine phosphoribosyltransferase family protein [Patescibacteria group bacterium]